MNIQSQHASNLQYGADCEWVVRGRESDVLTRIREPAVDLVLWDRRLPRDLEEWLCSLGTNQLPCGRVLVTQADLRDALNEMFEISGTPNDTSEATALINDISDLARRYTVIADSKHVDLRLAVVRDNECWKFHRDNVALRLITTYLGPGTQYIAPADAENALRTQQAYNGPIRHIPKHAVALFKGSLGASARGVIHRSPPIVGSGLTRLLLCLNQPSPVSPALRTHLGDISK